MVVTRPCAVARYLNAPLLAERESYLRFLASQGRSRTKLRDAAGYMIHVIEQLKLKNLRPFSVPELRGAAHAWSRRNGTFVPKTNYGRAAFLRYARGWLRFHGKLIESRKWYEPLDNRVELYRRYLRVQLGFAPRTIDSRTWDLNRFLSWLCDDGTSLKAVTVAHVERYLDFLSAQGWKQRTISSAADHLKVFFRFAGRKRWSAHGIGDGVFGPKNPSIVRMSSCERGPHWSDVRRLIDCAGGANANDYRARAVLLLLSAYALRTSEICRLLVSDVNFNERILTIRRRKSCITQRFPLNWASTVALRRYLVKGRPNSAHPNLFLTLREPYGPIQQASVYNITRTRINKLGINSVNKGAHAIRHSCANRLLRKGTPVPKVASLLGHVSSQYIGTYIQHSIAELQIVADFSLRELWNFRRPSRNTSRESA
jgi:integrase/recombinase XerD